RFPRLQRIIFDNTLGQKEAVELAKSGEGRVDLVTGLSPLETLRVAESPFAAVVKNRGVLVTVFGQLNMRKTGGPWHDIRLDPAGNYAINREDLITLCHQRQWGDYSGAHTHARVWVRS